MKTYTNTVTGEVVNLPKNARSLIPSRLRIAQARAANPEHQKKFMNRTQRAMLSIKAAIASEPH